MSAAVAAAATAAQAGDRCSRSNLKNNSTPEIGHTFFTHHKEISVTGRYESQKRRDWNTFRQYLLTYHPTLAVSRCSEAHVIEFLNYIDQFGKIKVHNDDCRRTQHQLSCPCPLRQAWASLNGIIGRLFAAYEDNGGLTGRNPFGARAVRLYLVAVRESQAKVRGGVVQPLEAAGDNDG